MLVYFRSLFLNYTKKISYLFLQLRQELERVVEERNRMMNENNEILKLKEECEIERKTLRAELREIKFRETRLFADYSELEEENISLQKQVSVLKSSQVGTEFHKQLIAWRIPVDPELFYFIVIYHI